MPQSRRAPFLVPAALWLWLFFHLHFEWTLNPQYQYGWAVPFAAAFLFYLRWQDRPPTRGSASLQRNPLCYMQILLLFSLLPVRLIEEANPDWRLLSWCFALIAVAYSLLSVIRAGGSAWLRYFAFPICLPLVSVPWLVQFENPIVQGMTRAVAFAAVEIVGWFGIGALQIGNVIELHNGFVGVNDACSGVKTFQAAIMVTLVLGELARLSAGRRLLLLVAGCVWVFACNILRATMLVVISAQEGTSAIGKWHDLIGTIMIVLGMAGLLGISRLLRKELPAHEGDPSPASGANLSLVRPIFALLWLALIFGASEFWYREHETHLLALPAWSVRWPNETAAVRTLPIPDETRAILKFNQAENAAWENPRAVQWWTFFARWEPQRAALQLVRSHSPEICLPAVGRKFVRELPPPTFETAALPLRFRAYEFEQNGRPLFVFVCVQEDKIGPGSGADSPNEWTTSGRLRAVWQGQRNLGQRLLEIAVIGFDDYAPARDATAATMRQIVQPTG